MFYFLQKHRWLQVVVIAAAMAYFCVRLFSTPLILTHYDAFLPCAEWLSGSIVQWQSLYRALILLAVISEGVLLINFFHKSNMLEQKSFFPIIWFVGFMVVGCYSLPPTPVFITNLIILCLVNLNKDYQNERVKTQVLLSGGLIGVASFFDFTAVLLLFYVIIALAINRFSKLKDMIVTLLGFLIPYIYMFSYHFFVDDVAVYAASFQQFHLNFPLLKILSSSLWKIAALAVFILLIPFVLVRLKMLFDNKLVIIRQRYITLNFLFLTLVVMMFLSNIPFPYTMGYLFVPLSFYFTAIISDKRISFIKEVVLFVLVAAVVVLGLPI